MSLARSRVAIREGRGFTPSWPYTQSLMDVHFIDGTYELFRHFYAVPSSVDPKGREIGAVGGVLRSVLSMIEGGAIHLGVATDHVVESFRNELYAGYKTSEGVPPALLAQFPLLEQMLAAMGVAVWPMTYFEADDALASAAARAALDPLVRQVIICTPDKDLAQCVVGKRIVQLDRRRGLVRDDAGVVAKFGRAWMGRKNRGCGFVPLSAAGGHSQRLARMGSVDHPSSAPLGLTRRIRGQRSLVPHARYAAA